MIAYKNISRNSGIRGYALLEHAIIVEFDEGGRYRYDASAIGEAALSKMKQLAEQGHELNTYINQAPEIREAGIQLN